MMKKWCFVLIGVFAFLASSQAQCINGNCYSGKGTYVYPSGARYVGDFRNGKIHGEGILYFSNGNKYVGQWVNQYREGQGRLVFASGEVYEGAFRRSKFSGRGTMVFKDGEKYTGQWEDDIQHGQGTYYYSDGDRYEGTFKRGKLHGKGTMFYADGSRYVGQWKGNYKDGRGTYVKANGKRISGLWNAGKYLGKENVSETPSSQTEVFSTQSSSPGNELRDCNSMYCKDGQGTYKYTDGSKWVGQFRNGKPEGQGTCYYSNGDKYIGSWKRHAPHGDGVMHFAAGRVLGANWNYGTPVRQIDVEQETVPTHTVSVDRDDKVKIWAVVVGVARYSHMPVLKFTDDDAYQIYAFLKSPAGGALKDDQIRVLVDEEATRKNILGTMRDVFLKADENDVVVLYFSGHGLPGAFLPVDFDGFNNRLKHEDIQAVLKQSKAKHKLCLADACHSGSLTAMRSTLADGLKDYYSAFENSEGGTALLLSSKGSEVSLEDHGLRQGIFSHFLMRGLKGEADFNGNSIVTIKELFDFVHRKVRAYTANAQTPKLSGEFDPAMPVALVRR
ncbi:MAG: caspase family protein [Bacteroidota bacterium]